MRHTPQRHQKNHLGNRIKNERGSITTDFLFALVLVTGFSGILLALSLTLTVVEVTQYITYASARNYYASHYNGDAQEILATQKHQELISHPVFAPLFSNGWFEIQRNPTVGSAALQNPNRVILNGGNDTFYGTSTEFLANMLDFEIPFYGSTASEDGGFRTRVASYLGRESTFVECQRFITQRWERIKELHQSYQNGDYPQGGRFFEMFDNGC
jgi:hypothetical protein